MNLHDFSLGQITAFVAFKWELCALSFHQNKLVSSREAELQDTCMDEHFFQSLDCVQYYELVAEELQKAIDTSVHN